jgi:hypothetical protein
VKTAAFHAKRCFSSKALLGQPGGFEGFGSVEVPVNDVAMSTSGDVEDRSGVVEDRLVDFDSVSLPATRLTVMTRI